MSTLNDQGFGLRLRQLRAAQGVSQAQLATSIGRHQTAIGPYERGEYMPARDVVDKLAEALQTSPEYLLFGRSPYRSHISVSGSIDASGRIESNESQQPTIAIDERALQAFRVSDSTMIPAFEPGCFALVRMTSTVAPAGLLGRIVLAELNDGRRFLRRLHASVDADRFDLAAFNAPTLHSAQLADAWPVVGQLAVEALQ